MKETKKDIYVAVKAAQLPDGTYVPEVTYAIKRDAFTRCATKIDPSGTIETIRKDMIDWAEFVEGTVLDKAWTSPYGDWYSEGWYAAGEHRCKSLVTNAVCVKEELARGIPVDDKLLAAAELLVDELEKYCPSVAWMIDAS